MKIAVGTTSEQKLGYLREILEELSFEAELIALGVASEISEQPIDIIETKAGSINRAKNALSQCCDVDASLGIEVGYHPNENGDYEILCWATLIDKNGQIISMMSDKLLLPEFHQRILKDNKYLGDYVRQYLSENPDNLSQEIGEAIRGRKPFIQGAVRAAIVEWIKN